MKLNYLKEYIKRRIEHAESRFNSLKERHGDNPMVSHTYGGGQSLGYWQGMIDAYDNILDIIESSDDENNKYDEEERHKKDELLLLYNNMKQLGLLRQCKHWHK